MGTFDIAPHKWEANWEPLSMHMGRTVDVVGYSIELEYIKIIMSEIILENNISCTALHCWLNSQKKEKIMTTLLNKAHLLFFNTGWLEIVICYPIFYFAVD